MVNELFLNSFWEKHGASFTEESGWRIPSNFNSLSQELNAAKTQGVLYDTSHRGRIKLSGADHKSVLHNIVTNDIISLETETSCHTALLSRDGKILLDMRCLIFENEILLDVEHGYEDKLEELIQKYVITEEVIIQKVSSLFVAFYLIGPHGDAALNRLFPKCPLPKEDNTFTQVPFLNDRIVITKHSFLNLPCYEILAPKASGASLAVELLKPSEEILPIGYHTYELLRIIAGTLRYGKDMNDSTLLSETGLDKKIVSQTKGCYPGQEVVAKIETYKGLKFRFCQFHFEGNDPSQLKIVRDLDGGKIGWITSAVKLPRSHKCVALGYISTKFTESECRISQNGADESLKATILPQGISLP